MTEDAHEDDISLRELFSVLWSGKILILSLTLLASVISVGYALSLPNVYQSSALLSPAEDSGNNLSGMLSQYGGLAGMAGLPVLGGGEVSKTGLALEVIRSRAFIKEFISKHNVLPELLALDHWDPDTRELVLNSDLYNQRTEQWIASNSSSQSALPSDRDAFEAFIGVLGVSQNKKSNLVTISIKHQSPDTARQWVSWLVEDINETIRQKDIKEAEESIEYLKRQAAGNAVTDLDQVFFELMQAQMQKMMLAEVRREYVLTTIDPAIAPEIRVEPNRALTCILGAIFGGIIGVLISLIRYYAKTRRIEARTQF